MGNSLKHINIFIWLNHFAVYLVVVVYLLSRVQLLQPHGLPGFSVLGIFQARILKWVAISFSTLYTWKIVNEQYFNKMIKHLLKVSLDHRKSKRIPEKHPLLLYWSRQNLCLCRSQQAVENYPRDGNTRPPDLSPEKSVCRSRSNC